MTLLVLNKPGYGTITTISGACKRVGSDNFVLRVGYHDIGNQVDELNRIQKGSDEKITLVIDVEGGATEDLLSSLQNGIKDNVFAGRSLGDLAGVILVVPEIDADKCPAHPLISSCRVIRVSGTLMNPANTGKTHLFTGGGISNHQLAFAALEEIGKLDKFVYKALDKNKPKPEDLLGFPAIK